jgi:hypothetical protein
MDHYTRFLGDDRETIILATRTGVGDAVVAAVAVAVAAVAVVVRAGQMEVVDTRIVVVHHHTSA